MPGQQDHAVKPEICGFAYEMQFITVLRGEQRLGARGARDARAHRPRHAHHRAAHPVVRLRARLARLEAVGRGESQPVVDCKDKSQAALIKCLEPNRRVEVEAQSNPLHLNTRPEAVVELSI